jgi:hypothetical protein
MLAKLLKLAIGLALLPLVGWEAFPETHAPRSGWPGDKGSQDWCNVGQDTGGRDSLRP